MKKLAAILIFLVLTSKIYSQSLSEIIGNYFANVNYSITLGPTESFVKISYAQILDSIEINQVDDSKQFQSFRIEIDRSELKNLDSFMQKCKSIQSIIDTYGETRTELIVGSREEDTTWKFISGFYYAIKSPNAYPGDNVSFMLIIMYPRKDKITARF